MRILLTFTSFHDPYSKRLVGEDERTGQYCLYCSCATFDLVYLLSTPNTERNTAATAAALNERVALKVVPLPLQDPPTMQPS